MMEYAIVCLFTWRFSSKFIITVIWLTKPVDLSPHGLSSLYNKQKIQRMDQVKFVEDSH